MSVDVTYQGVVLAKGAEVKQTPGGLFVELELPMPVGTRLALVEGGVALAVRVQRVHEGVGPGVLVIADAGAALPKADSRVVAESVPQHSAARAVPEPIHDLTTEPLPKGARRGDGESPLAEDGRRTVQMEAFSPDQLAQMADDVKRNGSRTKTLEMATVVVDAPPAAAGGHESADKGEDANGDKPGPTGQGRRKRKKTRSG